MTERREESEGSWIYGLSAGQVLEARPRKLWQVGRIAGCLELNYKVESCDWL